MFHPARATAKLWHAVSLASSAHSSANVHSLWRSPLLNNGANDAQPLAPPPSLPRPWQLTLINNNNNNNSTVDQQQQQHGFHHNPLWCIDSDIGQLRMPRTLSSVSSQQRAAALAARRQLSQMPFSFSDTARSQSVMDNITRALENNPEMDIVARRNVILNFLMDAFATTNFSPVAVPMPNQNGKHEDLNLIAQRVFAKLNDIEGLREWKKFTVSGSVIAPPGNVFNRASESCKLNHHNESLPHQLDVSLPSSTPTSIIEQQVSPSSCDQEWQQLDETIPILGDADAATQESLIRHRKPYLEHKSSELLSFSQRKVVSKAIQTFESLTGKHLTPLGDATATFFQLLATENKLPLAITCFHKLDAIEQATAPRGKLNRHLYFLYNSIVSAACSAGEAQQAMNFYADMKTRLDQMPDLRTVTKMFTMLAKIDDDMLEKCELSFSPTDITLDASQLSLPPLVPNEMIIDVVSPTLTHMLTIFNDLRTHKITPYPLLFNLLLSKCTSTNNLPLATHIFACMKQRNTTPTAVTFSTLISAHLGQHDLTSAENLFDEMTQHPLAGHSAQFMNSIGPFNALLGYYILQRKDWSSAHRIFHEVYEARGFNQFVKPTGYTFHLLVLGAASLPTVDCALGYLPLMRDSYHIAPTTSHFTPILELLLRQNRYREARLLVTDVMQREYGVGISTLTGSLSSLSDRSSMTDNSLDSSFTSTMALPMPDLLLDSLIRKAMTF